MLFSISTLHVACFLCAGGENFVALDLIVQHVHSQLEKVRNVYVFIILSFEDVRALIAWAYKGYYDL